MDAADAAFSRADLATIFGSTIHFSTKFSNSQFNALNQKLNSKFLFFENFSKILSDIFFVKFFSGLCFFISSKIFSQLKPQFSAICLAGDSSIFLIIENQISSSGFFKIFLLKFSSELFFSKISSSVEIIFTNAVHHHAITHSKSAALVAESASSILNFFSFASISVAAQTLIIAIHQDSFQILDVNFSDFISNFSSENIFQTDSSSNFN
jgi:hypothetical protein